MPFYQSNWNELIDKPGPPAKVRSTPTLENDPNQTEVDSNEPIISVTHEKAEVLAICEKLSTEVSAEASFVSLATLLTRLFHNRCKT